MSRAHEVPFAKYHALGNDFIVARGEDLPKNLEALARAITDRHMGVGADGLLAIVKPRDKSHDARVRFFNADGGEAEMSGNGIRCAAAFLSWKRRSRLALETLSGIKTIERAGRKGQGIYRVDMGAPILAPAKIPFRGMKGAGPVVGFPLRTSRGVLNVTVTSMGNPHCTVRVSDFAGIDWRQLGKEIERHPFFPKRTNVEFVKVLSKREIDVRFWERGVGETLASGTGSCGATVACILNGLVGRSVRVRTKVGALEVEWPKGGSATLVGPVQLIAHGVYHLSL